MNKIEINGVIDNENINLNDIKSAIDSKEDLQIIINSPGGDIDLGLVIFDLLKSAKQKKTCILTGLVASAASVIAMCGDKIKMSENALMLIHHAMTYSEGNVFSMNETIDTLSKIDEIILNIYKRQSNLHGNKKDLRKLMDENNGNGRFITAEEALDYGLIDEITSSDKLFNFKEILKDKVIMNYLTPVQIQMLEQADQRTYEKYLDIRNAFYIQRIL